MIGTTLGPYRIEDKLGEGGMGEVYKAVDPRLGRHVAIKVLPVGFAADPERLSRFEQEARAAAALNHPHIASVFDVGTDGETRYIVQEYLEGATLRTLLTERRDRPFAEWLPIAADVAGALAAAHTAGIIHRDIKPENVIVSADGHAKVLDFGLAKLTEAGGAGADPANSPTKLGTMAGVVMGTVGYLSPEQAAGQPVDRRTDIFSLGCILYEMAAGERPFAGRSAAEMIAHVLHDEPRPLADVRPNAPAELQRIVRKCIAKEPSRRYQHADDLALDLRDLQARPAQGPGPAVVAPRARGVAGWLCPAAALVVAGVAAWGWMRPAPPAPAQPPSRLALLVPSYGGASTGIRRENAITPDGSTIVFSAVVEGQVRTMRLRIDEETPSPVPGVIPFIADYVMSPDGREFIATAPSRQLFRHSVTGGNSRPLPPDVPATPWVAWAEDGSLWLGSGFASTGLTRVGADGAVSKPFGNQHGNLAPSQVFPGNRTALVRRAPTGTASGPAMLLDLQTGATSMLIARDIVDVRHTQGHLVYVLADGTIEAVAFDPGKGRIDDEPVRIAGGVALTGAGTAQFAVALNGTVAYVPEEPRSLVLVARDGSIRPATSEGRNFHSPMFSPDGRRIAVDFNTADGRDVWVLNLADGLLSRTTFERDGHDPTWTPDGTGLTYTSLKDGILTLFRTRPGVSTTPERLGSWTQLGSGAEWLSDSSALVTVGNSLSGESGSDVAWIRNGGKGPLEPLVASRFEEQFPTVSPGRRWLAFVSNQSGRDEVYVRSLKGESDQRQVSLAGGTEPAWSRDGRELFYRTGAGPGSELIAASVRTEPAFAVLSRRTLFSVADVVTATPHRNYDVSPDGTTFAMVRFNPATRIMLIQNLPALVSQLRGTSR